MDAIIIGKKLRELRGSMTQSELSRNIGVTTSAIGMYECGIRIPRDDIKIRFADFFGKSVEDIFYSNGA